MHSSLWFRPPLFSISILQNGINPFVSTCFLFIYFFLWSALEDNHLVALVAGLAGLVGGQADLWIKTFDVANKQKSESFCPKRSQILFKRGLRRSETDRGLAGHFLSGREVKSLKENLPQDNDDANDSGKWMKDGWCINDDGWMMDVGTLCAIASRIKFAPDWWRRQQRMAPPRRTRSSNVITSRMHYGNVATMEEALAGPWGAWSTLKVHYCKVVSLSRREPCGYRCADDCGDFTSIEVNWEEFLICIRVASAGYWDPLFAACR